jgi:tRNA(Ile)-lysidine synthase
MLSDAFLDYVKQEQLLCHERSSLLAVSGGLDSVVLCHLFASHDLNFAIAHVNFGLRGLDSDADEAFVKALAAAYQVPFHSHCADTLSEAKSKGLSIQMAAREIRYRWFEHLRTMHDYGQIVTAHHADDQAETMLLNLIKGAGVRGVAGMHPKNAFISRPLLFASKQQLLDYARAHGLQWREDESNQKTEYQRNALRLQVFPVLEQLHPSASRKMAESSRLMAFASYGLELWVAQWREEHAVAYADGFQIPIKPLQDTVYPDLLLFELLRSYGFHAQQCAAMLTSGNAQSGQRFSSSSHEVVVERSFLLLRELAHTRSLPTLYLDWERDYPPLNLPGGKLYWSIEEVQNAPYLEAKAHEAYLALENLANPLAIRSWEKGDRFYPLGMQGQKLLSDFMIDAKIDVSLKEKLKLMLSQGQICWVMGHRIDERFKVSKHTRQVLHLWIVSHD